MTHADSCFLVHDRVGPTHWHHYGWLSWIKVHPSNIGSFLLQYNQYKKDSGEDDSSNSNSASRGNWWQGTLIVVSKYAFSLEAYIVLKKTALNFWFVFLQDHSITKAYLRWEWLSIYLVRYFTTQFHVRLVPFRLIWILSAFWTPVCTKVFFFYICFI